MRGEGERRGETNKRKDQYTSKKIKIIQKQKQNTV
jgi:hypothetical protein